MRSILVGPRAGRSRLLCRYCWGMETYRLTYKNGDEITIFEARHIGEAISFANEFDERQGTSDTTLWVRQDNGDWIAI